MLICFLLLLIINFKWKKLESNIKSGKYGGKSLTEYSIFDGLNENPGCVRPKGFEKQCELRQFNECKRL